MPQKSGSPRSKVTDSRPPGALPRAAPRTGPSFAETAIGAPEMPKR
jgi:hypothetical protein